MTIDTRQRAFIDFALAHDVLRFGDFTLKSGRQSPYFFNLGKFDTGAALAELGAFYADYMVDNGIDCDVLFGPAYKGIPLATAVAVALWNRHEISVGVSFNRKEKKQHGEGGEIIGAPLAGRVLVVDDVISAGISAQEACEFIVNAGAVPAGLLIALDRQEVGPGGRLSASEELSRRFETPVHALIDLDDLFAFISDSPEFAHHGAAIDAYRAQYAASA